MNEIKYWLIDSFTNAPFKGNPAAVFVYDHPIEDNFMQHIALEMNLSETAFVLLRKGEKPLLRWFTPVHEIDLCGHATLAAAHIYLTEINKSVHDVIFETKFVGHLKIKKNQSSLTMNFPSRPGVEVEIDSIPRLIYQSLSQIPPLYARKSKDLMLVYEDEKTVLDMKPAFNTLLDYKDSIIVTAKSNDQRYDFISRCFCPSDGILEDPVTGSAHCTLGPYWSGRLNKKRMIAYQASIRGGILALELQEERLYITGEAITIIEGFLRVSFR